MSYYNTTHKAGDDERRYRRKAAQQDEQIHAFFRQHPGKEFTPFEVLDAVFANGPTPITSVRRAMNTLTSAGVLTKTSNKRPGPFGKPNYTWKLTAVKKSQTSLF